MRRHRHRVYNCCFTRFAMTIALSMVVLAQGVLGSGAAPFPVRERRRSLQSWVLMCADTAVQSKVTTSCFVEPCFLSVRWT